MTLENAWKAAARAWWERLNDARGECDMWRSVLATSCKSSERCEKENEELRAVNHELSLARDKCQEKLTASEARADMWQDVAKSLDARLAEARDELADRESVIGFGALLSRIEEADRKHPRELPDGMPSIEGSAEYLAEARTLLARRATWMRALLCEVFEAQCELSAGNEERLADELLDVATVALRWRRAILERGTK